MWILIFADVQEIIRDLIDEKPLDYVTIYGKLERGLVQERTVNCW